ncbi:hypothetical protein MNBD_UNCLBAC01-1444 [hydrothermal vent metagenome]|uniref:Lipoprotein n=1 Tax=hydrothermal vent metagenome TaxID=652676 RepID=A0A3B1DNY0_9ZZZZ
MKIKTHIILIFLTFISCAKTTNKNIKTENEKQYAKIVTENIKTERKKELEVGNKISVLDTTEIEKEEFYRKKINTEFEKEFSECRYSKNGISNLNGKAEFWKLCEFENGKQIMEIKSHKGVVYYEEIYYSKNGKLIYAEETENYMPKNSFTQMTWKCQFYIKKDSLYTLISLGMGKSEDENWNPDVILSMFKKRMKELDVLQKNNG